jgi:hypothetical protein
MSVANGTCYAVQLVDCQRAHIYEYILSPDDELYIRPKHVEVW